MRGQPGFFDIDERLKRLSGLGDHLEAFSAAVDFEMFAPISSRRWPIPTACRAAGRHLMRS
jgi:hypothetical protein